MGEQDDNTAWRSANGDTLLLDRVISNLIQDKVLDTAIRNSLRDVAASPHGASMTKQAVEVSMGVDSDASNYSFQSNPKFRDP